MLAGVRVVVGYCDWDGDGAWGDRPGEMAGAVGGGGRLGFRGGGHCCNVSVASCSCAL